MFWSALQVGKFCWSALQVGRRAAQGMKSKTKHTTLSYGLSIYTAILRPTDLQGRYKEESKAGAILRELSEFTHPLIKIQNPG